MRRPDAQCREIEAALGGADRVAALTGSPACERFTGPQIRKFCQRAARRLRRHRARAPRQLVSRVAARRRDAPIDPGDGSRHEPDGPRATQRWSPEALDATAPDLAARLPPIRPSWEIFGTLSPYWQKRYALPAAAIVPWTGDNPSSLIGTGIIHDRVVAVSLGTSDTVFALTTEPAGQSSHVFRSPTGDFMNLVCFRNGSLAREWVRMEYGLDWDARRHAARESAGQRWMADAAVARDRKHAAHRRTPACAASGSIDSMPGATFAA